MSKFKLYMNKVLIIVFTVFIVAPLLHFNTDPEKKSVVLNKKLAQFPQFSGGGGGGKTLTEGFIDEFNAYVDDNIGFREEASMFRLAMMYKLLHKIDVPTYLTGKEGHLFSKNIDTFQGKDMLKQEELVQFDKALEDMKDYFEMMGAKFYFMTIPDKEQIYPEYYPEGIQRFTNDSKMDQLNEYLQSNNRDYALHIKKPLLEAKQKELNLLYSKNYDSNHWNMNGAFIGYQELMKYFKKDFPELNVLSKEDFNIVSEKSPGAMIYLRSNQFLNDVFNFDDIIYIYKLKSGPYRGTRVNDSPKSINLSKNDLYFHYKNETIKDAPKLLIMGDSYLYGFLLTMLSESFSDVYLIGRAGGRIVDSDVMIKLQKELQADIVLYECVERVFNYNNYINEMQKFSLIKGFSFPYEDLKMENKTPTFYVPNNKIIANSSETMSKIAGWAVDNKSSNDWSHLYLKVGNNYYEAQKVKRPDLAKSNPNYLMSGFLFYVPTNILLENGKVEFIMISNDKSFRYAPIEYQISTE